jgi:hypothetical protein
MDSLKSGLLKRQQKRIQKIMKTKEKFFFYKDYGEQSCIFKKQLSKNRDPQKLKRLEQWECCRGR